MLEIIEARKIGKTAWNALVKASPVANWFQTPEAYSFFNSLSFLDAFAFGIENEGHLKGVAVGYVQKDGGKLKQFFSRRAIITGGPLLADDITDEELSALLNALKTRVGQKAIYVEIRNFNDYGRWHKVYKDCGFNYEQHLNYLVDCSSEEKAWSMLKENRKRQIKKAIKEGVSIEEAGSENDVLKFYAIVKELYLKKVKKPLFPAEFFQTFYRNQVGKIFLVRCSGMIVGGILCPVLDHRTIYEWFVCGEDLEYRTKYPSVMATWAAIDYATKNSIKCFDFMGAGKPDKEYGVREFKSKFGGDLVEFGRNILVCRPLLYNVGKLAVNILTRL